MRWALLLVLVVALGAALGACKSDRERDCDRIRELFPNNVPRRYWDYDAKTKDNRKILAATNWRDADVKAAVEEYLAGDVMSGTGWTAYSPYSAGSGNPVIVQHASRLFERCDVEPSRLR